MPVNKIEAIVDAIDKNAHNFLDLSGHRFGYLTVSSEFKKTRKLDKRGYIKTKVRWKCACKCGVEVWRTVGNLRTGESTHCGCSWKGAKPEGALNKLYYNYGKAAKARGYSFTLAKEEFDILISGDCNYCGEPPSRVMKYASIPRKYNGVDRVENERGYEPDNCVTCCINCNRAKSTMTVDEFSGWIRRVYDRSIEAVAQW